MTRKLPKTFGISSLILSLTASWKSFCTFLSITIPLSLVIESDSDDLCLVNKFINVSSTSFVASSSCSMDIYSWKTSRTKCLKNNTCKRRNALLSFISFEKQLEILPGFLKRPFFLDSNLLLKHSFYHREQGRQHLPILYDLDKKKYRETLIPKPNPLKFFSIQLTPG